MEGVSGGGCQPGCGPADQSLGRDPNGLAGTLRLARTSGSVPSWAVDGCPSWRDLPRAGRRRAAPQDKPPSTPPPREAWLIPQGAGCGATGASGGRPGFPLQGGMGRGRMEQVGRRADLGWATGGTRSRLNPRGVCETALGLEGPGLQVSPAGQGVEAAVFPRGHRPPPKRKEARRV